LDKATERGSLLLRTKEVAVYFVDLVLILGVMESLVDLEVVNDKLCVRGVRADLLVSGVGVRVDVVVADLLRLGLSFDFTCED
jgi:hypothetical protein